MSNQQPGKKQLAAPFVVGGDGRVYINASLVQSSTITRVKSTGPVRAAS